MNRSLTPKQAKLVRGVRENLRTKNKTKPMGEVMLEAGYSKNQSLKPSEILRSPKVQESLEDVLFMISNVRSMALKGITKDKIDKSTAKDNASITDIMTKNHQLLSGKSTDRQEIRIEISEDVADKNK